MRKKCDGQFRTVRNLIAQRLDWNLQDAKVMSWGIKDGRLKVVLLSKCPRGAGDTRDYLETSGAVEIAGREGLDILVIQYKA